MSGGRIGASFRDRTAVGGAAAQGETARRIEALAARQWRHPTTGDPVRFSFFTIERWFYRALKERSHPVGFFAPQAARRCWPAAA